MKKVIKISSNRGSLKSSDIIDCVLSSNIKGVEMALEDDPNCVNDLHSESQMNASMLAALGVMPTFLRAIFRFGQYQDFSHRDVDGCDLLELALQTRDPEIISLVSSTFEEFAPHIVNNWPEP